MKNFSVFLFCFIFCFHVYGAEKSTTKVDPAKIEKLINDVSGVYKRRFKNGFYDRDATIDDHIQEVTSENILEVIQYSKDEIYFRTHLEFFNGHMCALWGIAKYVDDNEFLYQAKDDSSVCHLKINFSNNKVEFIDEEGCSQQNCGSRGSLRGDVFKASQKRPITYKDLILNSRQYKQAVDEHNQNKLK